LGRREPCEGGLKRSGLASTRGPEEAAGLALLLLANRSKIRPREDETEAEAVPGTAPRRQIRPDCGRRKRGMDAVADVMAVPPSARSEFRVRYERGQRRGSVGGRSQDFLRYIFPRLLLDNNWDAIEACTGVLSVSTSTAISGRARSLECGSIRRDASGQKNRVHQFNCRFLLLSRLG